MAKRPSLKTILLVGATVQVVVPTAAVAWLSHSATQQTLLDVVHTLEREIATSAARDLTTYLHSAKTVNQINEDRLARQQVTYDALYQQLLLQLQAFPEVREVTLAKPDGAFLSVQASGSEFILSRSGEQPGIGRFELSPDGSIGEPRGWDDTYIVDAQPWFTQAMSGSEASWSAIHQIPDSDPPELAIASVTAVSSPDAALSAEVALTRLSRLLATPRLGEGRLFVIERNAMLVAATGLPTPFVTSGGTTRRINATQSNDPIIAAAAEALAMHPGGMPAITEPLSIRINEDTDPAWLYAAPYTDGPGLDWLIVTVVPESTVTGELQQARAASISILAVAWSLSIAFAMFLAIWIGNPLRRLSNSATALAFGSFDVEVPQGGSSETLELGTSFLKMRQRLAQLVDDMKVAHAGAEEARRQAERATHDAEVASRYKSTFLANMSHELRTPLNAILGYTDLLLEEVDTDLYGEVVSDLARIKAAATHLLQLINSILDLSRIEAGRMDWHIEDCEVEPLLEEVADAIRPLVTQGRNEFEVSADEGVTLVRADHQKLRQTLINLIGNAAKFTRDGTISLHASHDDKGRVQFDVADTGIGIPEEKLESIFKAFQQVDNSSTRAQDGTGLGLALTKHFVAGMEGEIYATSTVGEGSCFTVLLPPGDGTLV